MDENGPYLYEKTMGFSQLDQPIFRKARIVFEDDHTQEEQKKPEEPAEPPKVYAELKQLEALRDAIAVEFKKIYDRFEAIKEEQV